MNRLFRITTICIGMMITAINAAAQNDLRVISYNILEGMKTDTTKGKQQFVEWVKKNDPDVLALQECNGFTQRTLEDLARSYGHPYAVIVKENGFPTGITSKYPIANIRKVNENMTHGFITCKIEGYNFVVLHLNPHKYQKRREEIATILKYIEVDGDKNNWLVMGDFNSNTPLDKDRFKPGYIESRHKAAKEKNPNIENLVDGEKIDFLVQQRMLDAGFVDAGLRYDEFQKAKTGKSVIRTNSRIDYIYTSKDLAKKIDYCAFIYDDFTKLFSDHVPVMLELKK